MSRHDAAEAVIDRLIAAQHGNITPAQIVRAGGSRKLIAYRTDTGELVADVNGVLRARCWPETWRQRLHARVLAVGHGAVASHGSAAALLGLEGWGESGPLDVTVTHAVTPLVHRVALRRTRLLPPSHVTEVDGIPCTTVGRTLVDLGQVVGVDAVHRAVDDVRRSGLATVEHLWGWVYRTAARGRSGPPVLRAALLRESKEAPPPDSTFNREVANLLRSAGVPEPELEHEVRDGSGRLVGRLDLAWPGPHVALEPAGMRVHAGSPRVVADDIDRRAALVALGWRLMECTWQGLDQHPELLVARVRDALAAAA